MRAAEHGLWWLAHQVGLEDVGQRDWGNLLTDIETKVKGYATSPRTTRDETLVTFYSEASATFTNFKNAWRNHVSHARGSYDEKEAGRVYNGVQTLLETMAANPNVKALL